MCYQAENLSQTNRLASRRFSWALRIVLLLLTVSGLAAAEGKLSEAQRQEIIRAFLAEHPFVHRALPRGKAGVRIEEDGKITPSDAELNQLIAQSGPAAKVGERAQITSVHFVHRGIVFDINGGPVKRKKWSDRVNVGVSGIDPRGGQPQATDDNVYNNSNGSCVFLALKADVTSVTADQIKNRLSPILDFKSMNVAEAQQKSMPPVLAAAIKNHHALVGMDKDMVTYAMGRPPRRVRESAEGQDYEEWIYGAPPQDVEFIRFVGDKVIRIEEMTVSGEKVVRTQNEVGEGTLEASADDASKQKQRRPDSIASPTEDERRGAPSLLRPGEKSSSAGDGTRDPHPNPAPDTSTPPPSGPN
jgi:hypothetical protein